MNAAGVRSCVAGLAVLLGASPGLAAQQDAFYPAVDLPLATTLADGAVQDASAPPPRGGAGSSDALIDSSHLTPSPNLHARDLDGDGLLDAISLYGGVTVWPGLGDGRFGPGTYQPTVVLKTSQYHGQWADTNLDGRLDAVFLGFHDVEVFFDQGDGSFVSSGDQPIPNTNDLAFNAYAVGLVDADALPDIVCRNGSSLPGTSLVLIRGAGPASFLPPQTIDIPPGWVDCVGLGDLNGDGRTDVATYREVGAPGVIATYTQLAGGGWAEHHPVGAATGLVRGVPVRDMTGDGFADVTVIGPATTAVCVGNGTGNIALPAALPGVGGRAVFADVDEDGLVDVVSRSPEPFGVLVSFAHPDGSLGSPVATDHLADPVDVGDFDRDGQLDLLAEQVVLRGLPDGRFEAPHSYELGVSPDDPRQVAVADFNEDGRPDVAAFNGSSIGARAILSDTGGTWLPPLDLGSTKPVRAAATGDLDGDGHADLLVSRALTAETDFWLGRGDGTFVPQPSFTLGGIFPNSDLGTGQFNLDPALDVVGLGGGKLHVRLGQGGGALGAVLDSNLPAPGPLAWFLVRNLDGDAYDDLVLGLPALHTMRCIGHGAFAPAVPVGGGPAGQAGAIGDVNGDGHDDIVVVDLLQVRTALGDGAGNFALVPAWDFTSERVPLSVALADVDGDGRTDLALGHPQAWSLRLGQPGGGWSFEPTDTFDLPGRAERLHFDDLNDDGRPDLLSIGTSLFAPGLTVSMHRFGAWKDAGFALQGEAGPPVLWPTGSLQAGTPLGLAVRDAKSLTPVALVLGLQPLFGPFKGGTLVPDPLVVVAGVVTDGQGEASLGGMWPAGVPAGTELWLQGWLADAAGPKDFAATNGVVGIAP